jgi:hypothetical protein
MFPGFRPVPLKEAQSDAESTPVYIAWQEKACWYSLNASRPVSSSLCESRARCIRRALASTFAGLPRGVVRARGTVVVVELVERAAGDRSADAMDQHRNTSPAGHRFPTIHTRMRPVDTASKSTTLRRNGFAPSRMHDYGMTEERLPIPRAVRRHQSARVHEHVGNFLHRPVGMVEVVVHMRATRPRAPTGSTAAHALDQQRHSPHCSCGAGRMSSRSIDV